MASLLPETRKQTALSPRELQDLALLHRLECQVCPLNEITDNKNPHMEPTGSDKPLILVLGEAPGLAEDAEGIQFVGESGKLLRSWIPRKYRDHIRYNNIVRTRPVRNQTPTTTMIECCRPSVTRDIERTKPRIIFGFGNIPLDWVCGQTGITLWRGRRLPVRIGTHTCWYYPMLHPAYLIRQRRKYVDPGDPLGVSTEEERMFVLDLERALNDLDTLPEPVVHTPVDARQGVEIITEGGRAGIAAVEEALHWATQQPHVGVDYETSCLRPYAEGARILSAAVGTGERAVALPLDHPESPWTPEERRRVIDLWCEFLRASTVRRFVHNLAFEHEWTGVIFGREYIRAGLWEDTASQASILDERRGKQRPGPLSLDWLVLQHFGLNLKSLSALDRARLSEAPLEAVLLYNGMDSKYHDLLGVAQAREIQESDLEEPYVLALRRVPTVVLTQMRGVPVDQREVKRLHKKYSRRVEEILADIADQPIIREFRRTEGREFKPLSNPDVLTVFRDMLGRPECRTRDKYTGETKYSASKEVLSQIDHPLANLILDLREAQRRISTYLDPISLGSPLLYPDGLLHAQFNTIFAKTGRLSADSPNLQYWPKRSEEGRELRRPIAAAPGELIVALDYGQIEARVIAMFTKDRAFCRALWERYDVHMEWAERIAQAYPRRIGGRKNLKNAKVMKDFRTDIKNQWTFPLFFGASTTSASGYLGIPESDIRPLYDEFWRQFDGVADWQQQQMSFYWENGFVECLTRRRRRGPLSPHQVYNSPVQGTAAEIVMDAMCRLSETGEPDLQPEINIHDDLTFLRVPEAELETILEKVLGHMLGVPFEWVNVPITVEVSVGRNWMEMEEIGTFSSDEWFK